MRFKSTFLGVALLLFCITVLVLGALFVMPDLGLKPIASVWRWHAENYEQALLLASRESINNDIPGDSPTRISLPFFENRKNKNNVETLAYSFFLTSTSETDCKKKSSVENQIKPCAAIFFPQIQNGGDFFINGKWVASVNSSSAKTRYFWIKPFAIEIPLEMMHRDGSPDLITVVQTTVEANSIILLPFYGRIEEVHFLHSVITFFCSTLPKTSNLFCLLLGLLVIRVWFASRSEMAFLYAGCAACFWSILFICVYWPSMPESWRDGWRCIVYLSEAGLVLSMTLFILNFIKIKPSPSQIVTMLVFTAMGPLIYLFFGMKSEIFLDRYWMLVYVFIYTLAVSKLFQYSIKSTSRITWIIFIQSLFSIVFFVRDYCVSVGLFSTIAGFFPIWNWTALFFEPIFLPHIGLPLLMFIMLGVLIIKYQENVALIQLSNQRLKCELARREAELEIGYQHRNRMLQDESARMERERIYQDVHDGLGSSLIAAIYYVKSDHFEKHAITALLKNCLDNLRRIVNGLSDEPESIQSVVFDYCLHLESTLLASKIQIHYDISTGPEICLLRNFHINLFRCVQEAIANTLKHSQCRNLYVELKQTESHLHLTIMDDGCGFDLQENQRSVNQSIQKSKIQSGLGIPGIHNRVEKIGGQLKIVSTPKSGTKIEIDLLLIDVSASINLS